MRLLLTLVICAFCAAPALAAFEGPGANTQSWNTTAGGGFKGPMGGAQAETVQQALTLPDDAPVILTGKIVQQMAGSKDKYLFRDATGEVLVDIDWKKFQGRTVTPQDTLRITGKVEKDFAEPVEVDVKFFEILK